MKPFLRLLFVFRGFPKNKAQGHYEPYLVQISDIWTSPHANYLESICFIYDLCNKQKMKAEPKS